MSVAFLNIIAATTGAGLRARPPAIGGVVTVPVVVHGLTAAHVPYDQVVHAAICTSLFAAVATALLRALARWRTGPPDLASLFGWEPGVAIGVIVAQIARPQDRRGR